MRLSAVTFFTVLSVQFFPLSEASGQLVGGKQAAGESSVRGKKTPISFHKGDGGRGVRRHPPAGLLKMEGGAGAPDRSRRKVGSRPQPGVHKLATGGKKPSPQLPAPKKKSQGIQSHLKGHGKFNTDTHSCFGIQSKTCKRPSDCDGCLGLYTCKLPRGKCDLKAVSRKTGGFSQSIQSR